MAECIASPPSYKMPSSINASTNYLFFMHGMIVESHGPRGIHPKHPEWGFHDYDGILKAFDQKGFRVISEERPPRTNMRDYSKKVAGQVKTLIAAGAPPENITVSGFSKGGVMTLIVSYMLRNPKINFVVLSGCCGDLGAWYDAKILPLSRKFKGRFLSVYDKYDDECGTCQREFAAAEAASPADIESQEIKLTVGLGHGQFWKVRKEWFEPVVEWIKKNGR